MQMNMFDMISTAHFVTAMGSWKSSFNWRQILISSHFTGAGQGKLPLQLSANSIVANKISSNHQPMHATMYVLLCFDHLTSEINDLQDYAH